MTEFQTNLSRRDLLVATTATLLVPTALQAASAAPQWRKLETVPYKGKQDDISFVTPDIGWYGNGAGKLYQTINGGDSWALRAEMPGTFIRALGFVDEKTGFLGNVGTDYYPGVTDPHPLYRTDDGGATWTKVMAPGIEQIKGICGIHVLKQKRIFQGALQEVAIIHAAGRVGGPAGLLRSVDGGATWSAQDLSSVAGMILDVKFLNEKTGFLCSSTNSDMEKSEAQILRTTDGGKSWTPVYKSGRPFGNCWKMSFPSRNVGYATVQSYDENPKSSRRVVIKTTNGGKSWKELPLADDIKMQEFGIGFADEKHGWVGTVNSGYETRDGGKTWTPVSFGRAVNKIRIVGEGAARRVFAIGVDVHRLDLG